MTEEQIGPQRVPEGVENHQREQKPSGDTQIRPLMYT